VRELQENPTWLPVVAAAITDSEGRLLLHRRPPGKQHAGLWEFPGGKVERHENPPFALIREINEELGLALDPDDLEPLAFAQGPGTGEYGTIVILLYRAWKWQGEPRALEGNPWGWFTLDEAARLPMPPLDVDLLARMRK
jgi:8-oxo-dGTP diphosphatase